MIRLSNIKLDLDHSPEELTQAILTMLNISADELVETVVFRRGIDARTKNRIFLLYTLDVTTSKDAFYLSSLAITNR